MAEFVQKLLTVITGFIEMLFVGGTIYGWAGMDYILTQECYFLSNYNGSNLNQTSNSKMFKDQQYNLELIFTLSLVLSTFFGLIGGVIMDRFGTMVFRNISTVLYIASCLAIAFSSPQISWLLYPAMITLATSGWFLYISVLQTANLFPNFRGTIANIINGAAGASVSIFSLAKVAYQAGISLMAIFLFMAVVIGTFTILRTHFLMPKKILPHDVPDDFIYGISEYCNVKVDDEPPEQTYLLTQNSTDSRSNISNYNKENNDNKDEENLSEVNTPSIKSSILNSLYILGTFSLVAQFFRTNFFVESFNAWLKYLIPHNAQLVSFDISVFGYVQLTAILCTILNGANFDLCFQYFKKKENLTITQAKLKSMIVVCSIASLISITYSVFVLIDSPPLQYVSMILFVYADIVPEANLSLLLIQVFPMKHFGTLYGLSSSLVGIATAMQYPFFYIAIHYFNGNFFVLNVISLILVILTLAHPANLYRLSRKKKLSGDETSPSDNILSS